MVPLFFIFDLYRWSNPSPLQAIILGITSRSFAGVVLLPFTVIKTRFEVKEEFVLIEEGWGGGRGQMNLVIKVFCKGFTKPCCNDYSFQKLNCAVIFLFM